MLRQIGESLCYKMIIEPYKVSFSYYKEGYNTPFSLRKIVLLSVGIIMLPPVLNTVILNVSKIVLGVFNSILKPSHCLKRPYFNYTQVETLIEKEEMEEAWLLYKKISSPNFVAYQNFNDFFYTQIASAPPLKLILWILKHKNIAFSLNIDFFKGLCFKIFCYI